MRVAVKAPLGVTVRGLVAGQVPDDEGLVARTRDDLSVISTEADAEDIRGVADKPTGGLASVEVPEAESVIPRSRKGELAIGRDNDIRDEVVVAVEDSLGVAVALIVAGQLPDDDGLVYSAGKRG